MTDLLIRDLPDDALSALSVQAAQAGMSRGEYARHRLLEIAQRPVLREKYKFVAFAESGARVTIERRYNGGHVSRGADHCTEQQFTAYEKAVLLVERNGPGDYERAYALLKENFDDVFVQ